MDLLRDRLWLWGHDAGVQNGSRWGLGRCSRMTPLEGAAYLDISNLIMVRDLDRPSPPYDQLALSFKPLTNVVWSIVGSGGTTDTAERAHVMDLARRFDNISGVMLDDFFRRPTNDSPNLGVFSPEELDAVRSGLRLDDKTLDLWVVVYSHQLDLPIEPMLSRCDVATLWTWSAADLVDLEANIKRFCAITPNKRRLLGCYLWDFGGKAPMPLNEMKRQVELAVSSIESGMIDGIVFLASSICDLELDTVEWTRGWNAGLGDIKAPLTD
ncbi:MAG: hypothetical protein QGH20_06620 [Candidatus Latescibacteria bacterium]|nr:hypothetical protein [Candidatus Latescibacterota bacterium]